MKTISFYRTREAYGEFSNFSPHGFTLDGKSWRTAEHYFQAQKFVGTEYAERIRETASPMIAARLGRSRKYPLRNDWEVVKDDVMRQALLAKFEQNPALSEMLLNTNDAVLIEHTEHDRYWGDGGDGRGRNRLGELLMELRAHLACKGGTIEPQSDLTGGETTKRKGKLC